MIGTMEPVCEELTLLLLSGAGRGGGPGGVAGGVAAGSSGNLSLGLRSPGLLGTERDTPRPIKLPSVAATGGSVRISQKFGNTQCMGQNSYPSNILLYLL